MKIILWIPYVLSQCLLILITIGLRLNTNISESDMYAVGGFIALYGALLVLSAEARRRYWPKGDKHGS